MFLYFNIDYFMCVVTPVLKFRIYLEIHNIIYQQEKFSISKRNRSYGKKTELYRYLPQE